MVISRALSSRRLLSPEERLLSFFVLTPTLARCFLCQLWKCLVLLEILLLLDSLEVQRVSICSSSCCSYQVDFFSYYDWQKSWHAPLLFELYSLTFMYLPLSPISVLPVVTKCPLISGNNFLEGMGRLMIINYNIFVYYVEWRVVNHLVWGGVPTICATHCRLVHYFHSLFWIYSCISQFGNLGLTYNRGRLIFLCELN